MSIKAKCTWGMGPDVLITSDCALSLTPLKTEGWGKGAGISDNTQISLTKDEAIMLIAQLQDAVSMCNVLEEEVKA